jgi:hypothetical protein
MTRDELIQSLADQYLSLLTEKGYEPRRMPDDLTDDTEKDRASHAAYFLTQIRGHLAKGDYTTARAHLFFCLGVLTSLRVCTYDEVRQIVKRLDDSSGSG